MNAAGAGRRTGRRAPPDRRASRRVKRYTPPGQDTPALDAAGLDACGVACFSRKRPHGARGSTPKTAALLGVRDVGLAAVQAKGLSGFKIGYRVEKFFSTSPEPSPPPNIRKEVPTPSGGPVPPSHVQAHRHLTAT
ncbi:hypothetical protein FB451DRAFT_1409404 [Mycena latifolia]|nr:hypothetical protein FB451DRAFT_1409404 [Mycena latifolia]